MDDLVDGWPERVLTMQRNWIGRSGVPVDFKIENREEPVRVFTTRPDTLYGATFFVIAPDARWPRRSLPRSSGRRSRSIWSRPSTRPRSSGSPPNAPRLGSSWECTPSTR